MLNTFIEKLRRTSLQDANQAAELLASCSLPDPDDLRRQLAAFESQRDADDAAWERLDRTSSPRAFVEKQQIAERRERLLLQIDALKSQIAATEKRRAALVALADHRRAMAQQIAQTSQRFYAVVLTASKEERHNYLHSIDGLVRAHARLSSALATVSNLREFKRQPDPLRVLADDLRARADEIDRALGPGMPRGVAAWPNGVSELIGALNDGRRSA